MSVCIKQVLMSVLKKSWIAALVTLVCAASAWGISRYALEAQYTASVMAYVYNGGQRSQAGVVTNGDTLASKDMAEAASVIVRSDTVLSQAAYAAGLPFSIEQLQKMVDCETMEDTEVVRITATVPDPAQAQSLANAVADTAKETFGILSKGGQVNVVDYAVLPQAPSSPQTAKNTALAAFLGLFLSLLFIYVYEASNRKIRCRLDLTDGQQQMLIGQIAAGIVDPQLYKAPCARLLFLLKRKHSRCVLFSSYDDAAPKAYACVNLAAAAGGSSRILVIDADNTSPQAQLLLYAPSGPGFYHAMAGKEPLECVYPTQFTNVSVMPLGEPGSPAWSERAAVPDLLTKLSGRFDYIFINLPPLTENAVLRHFEDYPSVVVLAVCAGRNTKEQLNAAVAMLDQPERTALVLYLNQAAKGLGQEPQLDLHGNAKENEMAKRE